MTSRFGSTLRSVVDGLSDKALGLPPGTHRVDVVRDVPVTMPDGVVLIGDLYRPAGEQPRPAVLVRTPYGRGRLGAEVFATPLARHGLPVFLQSTRGTAGSGGMFRPFTTEREDGLTTLAWLREQPWCDGRVASVGASYLGHTQWSVAPFADPPLVAASTDVTASRMTLAFFHGGAPGLRNALVWTAGLGTQERGSVRTMVMNANGIVLSGDATTLGIGAMTDARWGSFYKTMTDVGVFPAGIDLKKAYSLEFINKGVGKA